MICFADVKAARERIAPYILRTPLLRIPALDAVLGCEVYLKPENLQYTGSFKLRGATNRMMAMTEEQRRHGVIASSSGNHAQGVACAARRLGLDAVIVMPTNCNPVKLAGVKSFGATVILEGTLASERDAKVAELVAKEGRTEVHPYADPYVAAGQGTIGLEILEDCPEIDTVVAPIGGGGLISGLATAVRGVKPGIRVIGAEPAGAPRYANSRAAGKPVTLDSVKTIADGTRTNRANPDNFAMIEQLVDELVAAEDDDIRRAMRAVVSIAKIVAEPSSVMGIAAAMAGKLPVKPGEKVCFVISGGNNDLNLLAEVITK